MIIKKIFEELTFFGGIAFYLLILCFLYINKQYNMLYAFFFSLVAIYLVSLIIRLFYFKSRPKKISYNNLLEKIDASSFPSLHAARSSVFFIFLFFNFAHHILIRLILFIFIILVFYSRIYLEKHDLTDILGGILLGIFASVTFLFI